MTTVPTPLHAPAPRELTMAEVLRIAQARGAAPSSLVQDVPDRRSVAGSGAIIQSMSQCDVGQVPVAKPTPTERDWTETHLEGLKTVVKQTTFEGDDGKVRIRQDSNGKWWRFGGSINLKKVHGHYRFAIFLHRGANWDDYEHLQMVIDAAKRGAFLNAGWEKYTDEDGEDAYQFRCGRLYVTAGEASMFETSVDRSPEVLACTDERCSALIHEAFGYNHVADSVDGKAWNLSVNRGGDWEGEDDAYAVSVHVSDAFSADQIADLMNDLAWMQESCRRANLRTAA